MALPPHVDLAERTFETIISSDNNAIQVPTVFLSRWQSQLILQKYGWIKDPVGNYIKIDLSRVVEEGKIPGGLVISQHCGFLAPQRVILCYQICDNQFDMRIVDDDNLDILYFGFHHPINYHAMRTVDSTFKPPVQLVSAVDPSDADGQVGSTIPFEMLVDLVTENMPQAPIAPGLDRAPDNGDPLYIPGADGEPEEYIWSFKVNKSVSKGRRALRFPRFVVEKFEFVAQNDIAVLDYDTGETFQCKLIRSTRPSGYIDRHLTRGWYQYVKLKHLSIGDRIVCSVENPVTHVIMGVLRG